MFLQDDRFGELIKKLPVRALSSIERKIPELRFPRQGINVIRKKCRFANIGTTPAGVVCL